MQGRQPINTVWRGGNLGHHHHVELLERKGGRAGGCWGFDRSQGGLPTFALLSFKSKVRWNAYRRKLDLERKISYCFDYMVSGLKSSVLCVEGKRALFTRRTLVAAGLACFLSCGNSDYRAAAASPPPAVMQLPPLSSSGEIRSCHSSGTAAQRRAARMHRRG